MPSVPCCHRLFCPAACILFFWPERKFFYAGRFRKKRKSCALNRKINSYLAIYLKYSPRTGLKDSPGVEPGKSRNIRTEENVIFISAFGPPLAYLLILYLEMIFPPNTDIKILTLKGNILLIKIICRLCRLCWLRRLCWLCWLRRLCWLCCRDIVVKIAEP